MHAIVMEINTPDATTTASEFTTPIKLKASVMLTTSYIILPTTNAAPTEIRCGIEPVIAHIRTSTGLSPSPEPEPNNRTKKPARR